MLFRVLFYHGSLKVAFCEATFIIGHGGNMNGKQEADRIADRFEKLILPVLEKNEFGLIKTEYVLESGFWYLRAYITRNDEESVSIGDCTLVSRIVSKMLDKEDFIDDEYTLEVCSKGFLDAPQNKADEENTEE